MGVAMQSTGERRSTTHCSTCAVHRHPSSSVQRTPRSCAPAPTGVAQRFTRLGVDVVLLDLVGGVIQKRFGHVDLSLVRPQSGCPASGDEGHLMHGRDQPRWMTLLIDFYNDWGRPAGAITCCCGIFNGRLGSVDQRFAATTCVPDGVTAHVTYSFRHATRWSGGTFVIVPHRKDEGVPLRMPRHRDVGALGRALSTRPCRRAFSIRYDCTYRASNQS